MARGWIEVDEAERRIADALAIRSWQTAISIARAIRDVAGSVEGERPREVAARFDELLIRLAREAASFRDIRCAVSPEDVAPEAAAGGPLGRIRTGDWIVLDVENRRIDVEVPAEELDARPPAPAMVEALARADRGWERLYLTTVLGPETGADLDFLVGASGDKVARGSH